VGGRVRQVRISLLSAPLQRSAPQPVASVAQGQGGYHFPEFIFLLSFSWRWLVFTFSILINVQAFLLERRCSAA
jgi:hypothetical protein